MLIACHTKIISLTSVYTSNVKSFDDFKFFGEIRILFVQMSLKIYLSEISICSHNYHV